MNSDLLNDLMESIKAAGRYMRGEEDVGFVNEYDNGWWFRSVDTDDGRYMAWAARKPLAGSNPIEEPLSLDVWFEFGPTREEVVSTLKEEVFNLDTEE